RRVVGNLCIDMYRADRRHPNLIDLDAVGDISTDERVEDPLLAAEDAAVVRTALAALPPVYRSALVKRELEEKPLATIAAELDVPEVKVKHLLLRARRALHRILAGSTVD